MKQFKWAALMVLLLSLMSAPAMAQEYGPGHFSIGINGGYSFAVAGDAVENVTGTEFDHSPTFGGGFLYRFPMGFALGLDVSWMKFDYKASDVKLGTFQQIPVMLWAKYVGKVDQGITGHGGIGIGLNANTLDMNDVWAGTALNYTMDTNTPVVFGVNAGIDYFFTPEFSISLDGRYLYSKAEYTIKDATAATIETGNLQGHNISILLGLNYWFNLEQ